MSKLTRGEYIFLAFIFLFSFVPTFGSLFRLVELAGGPAVLPENPRATLGQIPIVLHIVSSFVFCLIGSIQFLPSVRRWRVDLHRRLGWIIASAGLVSALTGFWMTNVFDFPADLQGPMLYWGRVVLSTAMAGLIVSAVVAAKRRDINHHRAAMVRAYAIGQGASTQAVLGIAIMVGFGIEPAGFWRDITMLGAWALNLILAQALISGWMPRARNRAYRQVQAAAE